MRIIDIDRLVEIDNHIYYIKVYKGSVILMDNMAKIMRKDVKFSIEYKPVGDPNISVTIIDDESTSYDGIIPAIKKRIEKLDKEGVLAAAVKGS